MDQQRAREWCREQGLSLDVKNHGEHWIFQGNGVLVEFWPSTGRLVTGKRWRHAGHARDIDALLGAVAKALPRTRQPGAPYIAPAYLTRLRRLVETSI